MTETHESGTQRSQMLPACQRCRLQKSKCDRRAPKCSRCSKARAPCIIIDPVTSEAYSRDYIRRLESQVQELRDKVKVASATRIASSAPTDEAASLLPDSSRDGENACDVDETQRSPSTVSTLQTNAFAGNPSSLNFLRSIFADQRWRSYEPQLLEQWAERPRIPELSVKRNRQPPTEMASLLLDNYFSRFHKNRTFLLRRDVLNVFSRIYEPSPIHPASKQDYFRLFMVLALGAVTLYRRGVIKDHPFGWYLAAQELLSDVPIVGSLDAIQNLLLVARFGIYYHIGMSIWEISRFCMRQCMEQGLHLRSKSQEHGLLEEQHRRRVFWECYVLDRYSSGTLGRPFAINDRDITNDIPINASDETIGESSAAERLEDITLGGNTDPTEVSVFISIIQLRQITSRIYTDFYNNRSISIVTRDISSSELLSPGDVYVKFYRLVDELDTWRSKTPVFAEPSSLYETTDFYDFMLTKEKLLLTRAALHFVPKQNGTPPVDLLQMLMDLAPTVIILYDKMSRTKSITWNRTYFQIIFTAGLSIIYCLSMSSHNGNLQRLQHINDPLESLYLCSNVLSNFKQEMPDAGRFAVIFEMLKNNLLRDPTCLSRLSRPSTEVLGLNEQQSHGDMSSSERLSSPPDVPRYPTNIETLATIASWPGSPGGLTTLTNDVAPTESPTASMLIEIPPGIATGTTIGGPDSSMLLEPMLTNEIFEQLEAGLSEYAWDIMETTNSFPYSDVSWVMS